MGSAYIFPALALESITSPPPHPHPKLLLPEALVPFIGEYYLESKIWLLGVLTDTWVSWLLVPLSG